MYEVLFFILKCKYKYFYLRYLYLFYLCCFDSKTNMDRMKTRGNIVLHRSNDLRVNIQSLFADLSSKIYS